MDLHFVTDEMDQFQEDNFLSRRTTGHNMYDPESLLTGAEEQAGLTYHDKRVWPSKEAYELAVLGSIPVEEIPFLAPRVKREVNFTAFDLE